MILSPFWCSSAPSTRRDRSPKSEYLLLAALQTLFFMC